MECMNVFNIKNCHPSFKRKITTHKFLKLLLIKGIPNIAIYLLQTGRDREVQEHVRTDWLTQL